MKFNPQQRFDLVVAAFKGIGDAALYAFAFAGFAFMLTGQPSRKPVAHDNTVAVARAHAPIEPQKPIIGTGSAIFPWCPPICPRDGAKK